jgi:hypothetical protein
VEAGLNTSNVAPRVVGGNEKGSLKSETVKYGRESQERLQCDFDFGFEEQIRE